MSPKDKICILVTHQLQYLKNVKQIVVMNTGSIQIEGNYDDIKASSSFNFLKNFEQSTEDSEKDKTDEDSDESEVF